MAIPALRWRLSSSSAALIRNRNFLCRRAFSAAEEHAKINLGSKQHKSDGMVLLGEARSSKDFESFKSWIIMIGAVFRGCWSLIRKQNDLSTHAHTRRTNINLETKQFKVLMDDAECGKDWKSFKSWAKKHKKKYGSKEEVLYRFGIFRDQLKFIEMKNRQRSGCTFGLNYLSDLTSDEVPKGGFVPPWRPDFKWNRISKYLPS